MLNHLSVLIFHRHNQEMRTSVALQVGSRTEENQQGLTHEQKAPPYGILLAGNPTAAARDVVAPVLAPKHPS